MLSRVAEHLYWMARYLERAEDTARLLRVTRHLMLDFPGTATLGWSSLVTITGADSIYDEQHAHRDGPTVLGFLCADRQYGGSILGALSMARENLRTTREVMPREVWEEVNRLLLELGGMTQGPIDPRHLDHFLRATIRGCQTLTGMLSGSLSEGPARRFCHIGMQLERADMTSRIVDVRSANLLSRIDTDLIPFENLQWMSVLKSLSAYQMYRQQVRLRVRGPEVMRFILVDERFPRSITHCLRQLETCVASLPRSQQVHEGLARVGSLLASEATSALASNPDDLNAFLDKVQVGIIGIHDLIKTTWFGGVDTPAPIVPE